ncbi:hypothetical protein BKA82DRAFT_28739 [Pisolithus tinctorius]|uniref:Uncharacterized protein n=1 Tax=Pisolithus tinctorius Marx 270 TaxID=870435 RepID=A0A0C3NKG9_PISTI|nr:hypothetical protein BKA82DRAFT_28739 [Pisolithus tinctorius]KIO01430.1 hypothetical protein M404DRAFT_28739 [Pisolithus tinctorius Marx 270]
MSLIRASNFGYVSAQNQQSHESSQAHCGVYASPSSKEVMLQHRVDETLKFVDRSGVGAAIFLGITDAATGSGIEGNVWSRLRHTYFLQSKVAAKCEGAASTSRTCKARGWQRINADVGYIGNTNETYLLWLPTQEGVDRCGEDSGDFPSGHRWSRPTEAASAKTNDLTTTGSNLSTILLIGNYGLGGAPVTRFVRSVNFKRLQSEYLEIDAEQGTCRDARFAHALITNEVKISLRK